MFNFLKKKGRNKMIGIDEFNDLLEEVADELPDEFFKHLNGGILLLPQAMVSPYAKKDDLYIMGRYCRSTSMGRYIEIYYGSFEKLYGHCSPDELKTKLREVVRHEFRHHMEGLAGEDGLEKEDEKNIRDYLRRG